jgi:hypothetical protein
MFLILSDTESWSTWEVKFHWSLMGNCTDSTDSESSTSSSREVDEFLIKENKNL